jgi:6-phosphogluconolactonase
MAEQLLFIGSYAEASKPGIYVYRFAPDTGALTPLTSFSGIANPSFLVIHPNGKWLYAVSETSVKSNNRPGAVWALEFDRAANTLRPLNHQPSGGDWPCHLALDATAKHLFVANYGTGSASMLNIQADGSLETTHQVQHEGQGPNQARQEGPHAHSTTITPDNQYAIVADLGIDHLVLYRIDSAGGKLYHHRRIHTRPGAGPRHLAFHPNHVTLYAANELANTVTVYQYDPAHGTLTEKQTLATLPAGAPENTVAHIEVSSAGDRVYVSNRGHDSIAVFAVNAAGELEHTTTVSSGGETPRNFTLAPDGKHLLVANQNTGDVTVFPLRAGSQEIGAPVAQIKIPGACSLDFHVYEDGNGAL